MYRAGILALLIASLFLLSTQLPGEAKQKIELREEPVFLVAGQSNAVSPAQGHPPVHSTTGLVSITDYYHGKALRVPTVDRPVDSGICWVYLGDLLGRKVTFVNIAQGSQSTKRWVDVHYVAHMQPALEKQKFDAILWHQGESDWGERLSEEESYRNMKSLIQQSRQIQPDIPWVIAVNSNMNAPVDAPIRKAQLRIISEGLALLGPDTDEIRKNPKWIEAGGAEFVGEGLKEHGQMWEEALRAVFKL